MIFHFSKPVDKLDNGLLTNAPVHEGHRLITKIKMHMNRGVRLEFSGGRQIPWELPSLT